MFVTGPDVIKTVTHEDVTKEKLGGAVTHNSTSGVAHFLAADDSECLRMIRELLSFLPQNNLEDPPRRRTADPADRQDPKLDTIVPAASNQPYDIKEIITRVVDDGEFFEGAGAVGAQSRCRLRALRRPAVSVLSPTSRPSSRVVSTSTRPPRAPGLSASATPLTFRL